MSLATIKARLEAAENDEAWDYGDFDVHAPSDLAALVKVAEAVDWADLQHGIRCRLLDLPLPCTKEELKTYMASCTCGLSKLMEARAALEEME